VSYHHFNFDSETKVMPVIKCLLYSIVLISSLQIYGQTENYYFGNLDSTIWDLEEVIVTATRTKRQLSALPLPATIIGSKELLATNIRRVSDILEEQTGLIMVPDFVGGLGVQMQGMDPDYTLILIDGMPLIGRSAGSLDLTRLTVGNIQQIEIVKGASSSLYGSDALAGVINIITHQPDQKILGKLGYQWGRFNSHDFNANYQHGPFQFFANQYSSSGYDLNPSDEWVTIEPFRQTTLQSKYQLKLGQRAAMNLMGRFYQQYQDYNAPGELSGATKIQEFNLHTKTNYSSRSSQDHTLEWYATQYQAEEYLNNSQGELFDQQTFTQKLIRPEWRSNFTEGENNTFTIGLGATFEMVDRSDFTATTDFRAPYLFIQWDGTVWDKVNIIGGLRYDAHNVYRNQVSPKVAVHIPLNEKWAIKGSMGTGYKAPDFRQLYFNFSNSSAGYGVLGTEALSQELPFLKQRGEIASILISGAALSETLNPERSTNFNLGITFEKNSRFNLNFNGFLNEIRDLIDTRLIARKTNGQQLFSYYNVAKVRTLGTEWNIAYKVSDKVKITGGYQWLMAFDKEALSLVNKGQIYARQTPVSPSFALNRSDYLGLPNRSSHIITVKLSGNLAKTGVNWTTRLMYRSSFGINDDNGNGVIDQYDDLIDGFAILDFSLNKSIAKRFEISTSVDNLLNYKNTLIPNYGGRMGTIRLNYTFLKQ
jgi:outer membrane receptor for ferrienterochelin and colicins